MERAEDNLCSNTTNMSFISKQADGAEKVRKDLERALMAREDAIEQLENKHKVGRTDKYQPLQVLGSLRNFQLIFTKEKWEILLKKIV